MKKTALLLMMFVAQGLCVQAWAQETIEISPVDKEEVSRELEREAESGKYDEKTSKHLLKVSKIFKNSKKSTEVEVVSAIDEDCVNCEAQSRTKTQNFFRKLGMTLGKGASWLTTTTAKPFMNASGFITGVLEKEEKNKDLVAFYKFFHNHQAEYDDLYLEAGTPEEMIELMLVRTEEIMETKSVSIMKDFLKHIGVERELPDDFSDFELSAEEIAKIDLKKVNPDFINNHPEFQEVRPFIGDMTQEDVMDIVTSGYFAKSISFDNYKEALPKPAEVIGTIVGQIFAPRIALGIVSSSLANLYTVPVVLANVGTGVSTVVCMENKAKLDSDKELRQFCSYVMNRSSYELVKSRTKGYVAGKNTRAKINLKLKERRERRALRRQQAKEEQPEVKEEQAEVISQTLAQTEPSAAELEREARRAIFYGKRK